MSRPKICACSVSDPFVLIIREDDFIGLSVDETGRGKIRRKDMYVPNGYQQSTLACLAVFTR